MRSSGYHVGTLIGLLMKIALLGSTAIGILPQMARAQTILGDTDIVTIPGTHASPWNTDSLFVGFASGDDAELRIGDGVLPGTVLSTTVYVGNAAGGQGTATLTGTGSEWFASGQFSVGFGGTGLVTIQEGARLVTDNAVVLARLVGSVGQMTVRDATWDVTGTIGALYVGHEGQGVLRLEEGAVVDASSRAVRLGHMSTGVGSVTITGDASLLADSLIVGVEGDGELTLQNGGTVVVNGGDGTLSIAQAAGSTGRLNIGGSVGTGGASAPTAVGTLDASFISFGAGIGYVNFNHTETDYFFDIPISGDGYIRHFAGTTTLGAIHSFTGTTQIVGGTLHVDGDLSGSTVQVLGGRLGGTGVIGDTLVTTSGVHAPGNSIGTQTINGSYINSGMLEIEVQPGSSDQIIVNGTVTVSGELRILELSTVGWSPAEAFTIIVNNSSAPVNLAFDTITNSLAFLTPSVAYDGGDGNDVVLTMTRNDIEFSSVAQSPNQVATADAVQALGGGNPIFDAVVALSAGNARNAFDALSGEVHASTRTALFQDSRFIRDAALNRLRGAFGEHGNAAMPVVAYGSDWPRAAAPDTSGFVMWGQAFGGWGNADGDGNAAKLGWSTGGLLFGGDSQFGAWRVGAAGGYSKTDFSTKARRSSGDSDNYHTSLYAGRQWGALALRTGIAYTHHEIATDRTVAFGGFSERLSSDYDGRTFQAFGEFGYRVGSAAASVEPLVSAARLSLRTARFDEAGGDAALSVGAGDLDTTLTTVGLRASTNFGFFGGSALARGMIGWRHAFGDTATHGLHAFSGADAFKIGGVPIAEDVAVIEAAFDFQISPLSLFSLSYDGQFGDGLSDQSAKANIIMRF